MLFAARLIRAARLEPALFEEVEADRSATVQSLLVVALASVAGSIWLPMGMILPGLVTSIIAWFVWALLTYIVGATVLPEPTTEANLGQMLRVIGFASAPGILRFAGIGILAYPIVILTGVWMLVAMVVGIRQALDYRSTGRAVLVAAVGWVIYIAIILALLHIGAGSGPTAPSGSVAV
jgi:hypothetical protein